MGRKDKRRGFAPAPHQPEQARPLEATVNPSDLGIYSDALNCHVAVIQWWRRFRQQQQTGTESDMQALGVHGVQAPDPQRNVDLARAFIATLKAADTFYVHDNIAGFVGASIPSVPDDALLDVSELPSRSGFMYFAQPIELPCHAPDRHYDPMPADWRERPETVHDSRFHMLRAISWDVMDYGGVRIGVDPSLKEGETRLLIGNSMILGSDEDGVMAVTSPPDGHGGYVVTRRPVGFEYESASVLVQTYVDWTHPLTDINVDPILPLLRDVFAWNDRTASTDPLTLADYKAGSGGADDYTPIAPQYVYGPDDSVPPAGDMIRPSDGRTSSIFYARKLLLAIASFMHQRLPAETTTVANGITRKRLAGTDYESRTIRVVHMRKRNPRESYTPTLDGERGRKMTGHWVVRPHPRNQWYRSLGPASDPTAHRLRWIQAYEKGDLSLPLKPSRTLFAVVR